MHSDHKHINRILKYLSDEMTGKERYAFERKMEADPFLKDAVEGFENLSESEIEQALQELNVEISHNQPKRIIPVWMRVAAVLVLLIGIGSLLFIGENGNQDSLVVNQVEKKLTSEPKSEQIASTKEEEQVEIELEEELIEDKKEEQEPVKKEVAKVKSSSPEPMVAAASRGVVEEDEVVAYVESIMLDNDQSENAVVAERKLSSVSKIRGISNLNNIIVYRGKVVDEEGYPLPGVTVVDQGTLKGTITDMDGNFEINVPKQKKSTLAFNSIGFKSKSVLPEGDSLGDVVMSSEDMALDEVVAVGYGSTKKKDITRVSQKAGAQSEELSTESTLIPEPEIGLSKFIKKVERGLKYPSIEKEETIEVKAEVLISVYGEVKEIIILSDIDPDFAKELKKKIAKTSKWISPKINSKPIESSRVLTFNFE